MASAEKLTITLSTKGQVILPKSIRQRRRWDVGTRLIVEDTPEGVLLRAAPIFKRRGRRMYLDRSRSPDRRRRSKRWTRVSPPRRGVDMLAIDTNLIVRYLTGDHPDNRQRPER